MDLHAVVAEVVAIAERAGRLQVQRRPSLVVKGTKAHVNDLVHHGLQIITHPACLPPEPVTRIAGGELRLDAIEFGRPPF